MNDGRFTTKSTFLQIVQFVIILIISFIAFSIGWDRLGIAHSDPGGWMLSVTIILGIAVIPLLAISWYSKTQMFVEEENWNFKEQEITLSEYKQIYKDYLNEYSHLISWFDIRDFSILLFIITLTYLVPFFMSLFLLTVFTAPYIFGIFVILYGFVFFRFSLKLIPGDLSIQSVLISPRNLQKYIELANDIDGIAFAGLFMVIGEAGGYYIISEIRPAARLEGIESAARIDFNLDESLRLKSLTSILSVSEDSIEVIPSSTEKTDLVHAIREIMIKTYNKYISIEGKDPLLADLLEELDLEES